MKKEYAILPILAGFFVMGFSDILGTILNQVKAECVENADMISWLVPIFAYVWFLLISIPAGVLSGRVGRKNAVLLSLLVMAVAMAIAFSASRQRWYFYVAAFALIGIGSTIIQAALPALMSNVVALDKITSRISLGQFVKALCAALTPVFVYLAATVLGSWKLIFPIYALLAAMVALWLWSSRMPDERVLNDSSKESRTSFASCFSAMKNPYTALMTLGILFSVGADVGMNVAIPEYLSKVFKVDVDRAGMGPTVYFVAKTAAAFFGAMLFARVSAAKCLPWTMALGLAVVLLMPLAASAFAFFVLVALMALFTANSFGMCMGLAIEHNPTRANEITSLMVMAIVGGGIVSAVLGVAQKAYGSIAIIVTLAVCLTYLFALGIFAAAKEKTRVVAG